jgi:hypothetical protein
LWWPLENSQGEVAGFLGRYAAQFAIPIETDGLNLGVDHFLDALRAHPTRVGLLGSEWPLSSTDGITVVEVRPVPRFLWWVTYRKGARHPQLGRFLGLLEETGRREGWLDFDPDRDWLQTPTAQTCSPGPQPLPLEHRPRVTATARRVEGVEVLL